MRKIQKTHEPTSLTQYKRDNPTHQYQDLKDKNVRQDIRQTCTEEQYYWGCIRLALNITPNSQNF